MSDSSKSSTSATGTSGSTSARATASTYKLDADDSKLTAHVGHKVEVTGTVEGSGSTSATASPTSASASSTSEPTLKVQSVRMIASSCSN
jgi:hypothetical protein